MFEEYKKQKLMKKLPWILIGSGFALLILSFGPLIYDEIWYYMKQKTDTEYFLDSEKVKDSSEREIVSVFGQILNKTRTIHLNPVNKDFSIIIEKIGINAPIIRDVSVTDENAYFESLKSGIAHAALSDYPSERPGNSYLFAHASLNFFKLGKYATVFNLLRKLDVEDKIHLFYEGDHYIYEVVNKEKVKGWDTKPLKRAVIEPVLTLQTCDPPGTTLNRLVITARLVEVIYADE